MDLTPAPVLLHPSSIPETQIQVMSRTEKTLEVSEDETVFQFLIDMLTSKPCFLFSNPFNPYFSPLLAHTTSDQSGFFACQRVKSPITGYLLLGVHPLCAVLQPIQAQFPPSFPVQSFTPPPTISPGHHHLSLCHKRCVIEKERLDASEPPHYDGGKLLHDYSVSPS